MSAPIAAPAAGFIVPKLQAAALNLPFVKGNPKLAGLVSHPAGPFTIHFWAPTAKWMISIANIADLQRPVEKMSIPQQTALTATGIIWSRYATQITPVNYNLLAVNFFMAATGLYQISRIVQHEMDKGKAPVPA